MFSDVFQFFLRASVYLRKGPVTFVMSVCLSVRPQLSAWLQIEEFP